MNNTAFFKTPCGTVRATERDGTILELIFVDAGDSATNKNLSPVLGRLEKWLHDFFDGKNPCADFKLNPCGTEFQKSVWNACSKIPYGKTKTYGDIAREIASAPRAVGGALSKNPIVLIVPCHRIVGAAGLRGYCGLSDWGIGTKKFLLELESNL
ncbi:MAG: methylated-DNA--[protein]-cysteine S-methyltransferase [Alphaproteobacteria bacterium]|nr:methylated-DNA--[protein]-cysteine S-methyltransferase [Alphaproteobacteria bacterium]